MKPLFTLNIIIVSCLVIGCAKKEEVTTSIESQSTSATNKQAISSEPSSNNAAITEKPLPLPSTGILKATQEQSLAPFRIRVDSNGYNYYVKLTNSTTDKTIATYFIRSGEVLDTKVPLGNYNVKYAAGKDWYGTKKLFGQETQYKKADEVFTFSQDTSGYSGNEIQLIMQVNGNLQSVNIDESQF